MVSEQIFHLSFHVAREVIVTLSCFTPIIFSFYTVNNIHHPHKHLPQQIHYLQKWIVCINKVSMYKISPNDFLFTIYHKTLISLVWKKVMQIMRLCKGSIVLQTIIGYSKGIGSTIRSDFLIIRYATSVTLYQCPIARSPTAAIQFVPGNTYLSENNIRG